MSRGHSGESRGSNTSVFPGGRRAKSLRVNASLHWSHARAGFSVFLKHSRIWMDRLVEAAASEGGAAVGAKIGSGSGTRFRGFATEILVMAHKAHKESAVMGLGMRIVFLRRCEVINRMQSNNSSYYSTFIREWENVSI